MTRKQIAISVPEELKVSFYDTAKRLGTNPSNLLTMFMAHVVHTREVNFKASDNVEFSAFSKNELEDLQKEGKSSYDKISSLVD